MVEEGFDVGIRSGPVPETNIVVRKLAEVPRVVCAAPDYLARHGTPMTPDDLLQHDCIRYKSPSTGRSTRWEFKREGDSVAFDVRGSLTFNDPLAVCTAACAGLGLAQLSTFIATPHIRAGTLLPVLIDHAPAHIPLFLHYPARRLLPSRVRVFIDFLLEKLVDHPDLTFDPRAMVPPGYASADREVAA
jgi:DNA-binding transcriptional LysR family regulator